MTEVVQTIKNIDGRSAALYLAIFISILAPGLLVLFFYKPELFSNLEITKVVLLSVSLSLPLWTFNALVLGPPESEKPALMVFGASLCSGFAYYISLYVAYWTNLSFSSFSLAAIIINLISITVFYRVFKKA